MALAAALPAFTAVLATALKLASATSVACLTAFCTDSRALLPAATALLNTATAVSEPAGRVLGGGVDDGQELLLGFGDLAFELLAELGAGAGGDVVQVTAVGSGLLGHRLEQGGLQGQQFLRVLDAQQALGGFGGFFQGEPWRR